MKEEDRAFWGCRGIIAIQSRVDSAQILASGSTESAIAIPLEGHRVEGYEGVPFDPDDPIKRTELCCVSPWYK